MTVALFAQEPEKGDLALDDEELRSILETEIEQAVNHATSEIAGDQERALEFYEGKPFGNEVEGSSQVVLRDVAETIDWAMPAIMRAMFYTHEVVRYEATTPDGDAIAAIQTKVVNEIFRDQLRGLRIAHDWAKAGMLERFGVVKFWIEQVREPSIQNATLSDMQLVQLYQNPDAEVFEATPQDLGVVDPATGLPAVAYQVRYKLWRTYPRMRLETVPPEEFLCSRRAKRLDSEIPFVAQRKRVTRSELHSLGVDWAALDEIAPTAFEYGKDGREIVRFQDEGTEMGSSLRKDRASQEILATESYIRVDYDGDGYSELRRVLSAGDGGQTILGHDYASGHGFAGWTPIPMPHKLYGRSYFDVVEDLQRIRSTLARQLLDNVYRMNNARHKLIEGEVDIDSYLDTAAGAPVLVNRMDAIEALEVPPLPSWSFEALSYFEKVREQRTGIHPYSQESYSAGANQTASGVSQVFEAAMAQVQLLCQMFAEGLSDLFRIIPRAMKEAGMGPAQIKVGDQWINYNPQEWPDEVRVSVEVGLSPGQTEQRIQRLMLLLGLQKEALQNFGPGYLVAPEQIFQTAVRIVEQSGFQNPSAFFMSPEGKQLPEPGPSPEELKVQADAADAQRKAALDLMKQELAKENDQRTLEIREQDQRLTHERELARIAMEERVRRYETDRQYEAALSQQQAQLAEAQSAARTAEGQAMQATTMSKQAQELYKELAARIEAVERAPRGVRKVVQRDANGNIAAVEEQPV